MTKNLERLRLRSPLLDLILKAEKRPGMYFGSANLDSIFRFLNGWQAHRRCVADDDPVAEAFKGFNEYVEAKYDDNRTVGWANMISEHTDNPDEEYQVFMNIFREFLSEKMEI